MIEAIKQVKESLAYATFADPAIKAAALRVLDEMDTDLTAEQYEPGTAIEEAASTLEQAINDTDSEREEAAAAASEDDEDEFAGLGDEDDDEKQK